MKSLACVRDAHIIQRAVLGLFVGLLFSSSVTANEPTPSQLSYFNAYKSVYGNSWNMVWNNGNSIPLAVYGGHFTPQTSNGSLSSNSLKIPSTYNLSSYTGLLNLAGCASLPSPQLPLLPSPQANSKLILTTFSPTTSYISPNSQNAINSIDFIIGAGVRPVAGLEPSQTQPALDNHKEFYLRWTITIENQNGNSAVLTGDTPIIPSNNIHQGADITIPVTANVLWLGKDQNGNILPDGEYSYQLDVKFIRIADLGNGNTKTLLIDEATTGTGTLIVDTTPPVISITTPPDGTILNNSSVSFTVNYSDCGSGIDISSFNALLNQNDQTSQFTVNGSTASWSTTLINSVYTFAATIKDNAGNPTMTTAHITMLAGNAIQQYTNTMAFLQSLQPLYGFKSDLSDLMPVGYFTSATQAMYVTTPNGTQQYVAATQPKYIRFQQMYDSTIRVYGATLDVALDTNNNPTDVFGDYYNDIPSNLDINPSVDFQTIMNAVLNDLGVTGLSVSPTSGERIIYKDDSGVYHVAIELNLVTLDGTPWVYVVDLHNASILYKNETQSAGYLTGLGNVFVDRPGGYSPCGSSEAETGCAEPLNWLANGGKKDCPTSFILPNYSFIKALTGRYSDITDDYASACCGPNCSSNVEVPYNSSNLYIYSYNPYGDSMTNHLLDEVNAYYNETRAAEYYLHNYGFELSHQNNHPLVAATINHKLGGFLGMMMDSVKNNCGSWQWACDLVGDSKSIDYHIYIAPGNADYFDLMFHEYNHAVVHDINGGDDLSINDPYSEGMAQFYACFYPDDLGYILHGNQCVNLSDPNYLYPYDVNYIPDYTPGDVHSMALVWDEPLERLRTWSIAMHISPQIIYDDTFNAFPRIGNGGDIRQGLAAMLAAEDNKQTPYWGFEDNYYNILASFAWNGIRIPSYTVNGQQTNANSIVIAGKLTTPPFSGNVSSAVQPLLSINYQTSSDFPDEQVSFDTFVGNGADSVLLISPDPSLLANQNVWNAAMSTVNVNALVCAFCKVDQLPNCPCPPATSGYVNGYPNVYYVFTQYSTTDDLPAGTPGGQTEQHTDHDNGIYNNLHKTISIRLGDMSGIAASSNPLSFGKLYYRLMTQDTSGNWVSSATRGEQ